MSNIFDEDYDLSRILVRPLYFGMFVNILIPMALLFICYYIENNQGLNNKVGASADMLFYVLGVLSVGEAALALWWRKMLMDKPMIRRTETFEEDFSEQLLKRSRPIFLLIASIAFYGFLYFYLTGRFFEAVFFVLVSFITFQIVRPRYGMARKLIDHQRELVKKGKFLAE